MKVTDAIIFGFTQCAFSTMLYNGAQKAILSPDLSVACDAAFNTTLDCPENIVQYVTYPIQAVNWNTSWLGGLCTPACSASLEELSTAITRDCGGMFIVNSQNWTFGDYMSHYRYKYDMICLADEDTGDFCLDVESRWNITTMVQAGEATWPLHTNKCYFDVSNGHWGYQRDVDGTCLDIFDFWYDKASDQAGLTRMAAADYFITKPEPIDDDNYGWRKFRHGLEDQWGDVSTANVFESNITDQVWANMQLNCGWEDVDISPANDYTLHELEDIYVGNDNDPVLATCPQILQVTGDLDFTCQEASVYFQVPTAGLMNLNAADYLDCWKITNTTLCAPLSCSLAIVDINSNNIHVDHWVARYANFTLTQFYTWNPYLGLPLLANGDAVCAGPPGGIYIPPSAPVPTTTTATTTNPPTSNSSSSTTATTTSYVSAPSPTVSGTTPYCSEWYTVQSGDTCDGFLPKYDLTLSEFRALNTYIDTGCSNLWPDYSYCVGGVPQSSSTTTSTSSSTTATTSSPISTPTPIQSGMVSGCTEFYEAKSGDGCWAIAMDHGITQQTFIDWNPAIGADCIGLWPEYWYCVAI
ncbi:hypothetical protein BJX66DRAFT_352538 [Aspergillus keveii]|uniref:LysM domain-containing protein n=1 Tax=Aspergillus keveii TaxID=714993 RepID=A0ABR4FZL0_9EURO